MLKNNARFDRFLAGFEKVLSTDTADEVQILDRSRALMAELVEHDDWLPSEFAESDPKSFKQYMLHRDPDGRFTVLCVVWGPNQKAGAHDHSIWGVVGQLRGAERTREYDLPAPGEPLVLRHEEILRPGETCVVSPALGDIHDVSNASDGVSISIHAYGGDLSKVADRRSRYDPTSGKVTPFEASYH